MCTYADLGSSTNLADAARPASSNLKLDRTRSRVGCAWGMPLSMLVSLALGSNVGLSVIDNQMAVCLARAFRPQIGLDRVSVVLHSINSTFHIGGNNSSSVAWTVPSKAHGPFKHLLNRCKDSFRRRRGGCKLRNLKNCSRGLTVTPTEQVRALRDQ